MNKFFLGFIAGYALMRLCNESWNNGYETAMSLMNNVDSSKK